MLSSLLRPKRGRRGSSAKPLLFKGFQAFRNGTPSGEETEEEEGSHYDEVDVYDEDEEADEDEEDDEEEAAEPILPIFAAPVLGTTSCYCSCAKNQTD